MSMSMPMTCCNTQTSVHKQHLPMLIPRILMSVNETHISTFCTQSLTRLCTEYALPEENATIECINSLINGEQMSRTDALALFFLLLNIDTQLKECMMVSEAEAQRGKLTNFCMNLRKHLVPEFMAVDQCNSSTFVTRCSDAWSVA